MKKRGGRRKQRAPVSKAVKSYVRRVNKGLGETKYLSNTTTAYDPIYSNTTCTECYSCAEGTGDNERVGLKIQPTSLQIRVTGYRGLSDSTVRLIVFRYNDRVNSPPVSDSVLISTLGTTTNYINSPYQLSKINRKRFSVLLDKRFVLDDGKQNHFSRVFNVKVSGRPIYFNDGTFDSERKNGIYYVLISDVALINTPLINIVTVEKYKDL